MTELTAAQVAWANRAAEAVRAQHPPQYLSAMPKREVDPWLHELDRLIAAEVAGIAGPIAAERAWLDVRTTAGEYVGRWIQPGEPVLYAAVSCAYWWPKMTIEAAGVGLKAADEADRKAAEPGDLLSLLGDEW